MRRLTFVLLLVAGFHPASGAPFIFHRGIANAASFAPPGLPNGSIARGSIFTIFGRDLGPAEGVQVSSFPLGNELAGVSIEVCRQQTCSAAIPLFVRADQINAIMRSDAPLGEVSMRVTYQGEAGNFSPAEVVASSVGLFSVSSAGYGPGVVQNFLAADNQPINSGLTTARRGQVVTLWATGLGPALNADNVMPQAGDLPVDVEIWVGNARVANKLYAGRSPCCSGVDQLVFAIPQDAPEGCWVPVHVRTAGQIVSNGVTIAIGGAGICADPHNPFQPALTNGGRLAAFVGDSLEIHTDILGVAPRVDSSEWAQIYFREERPGGLAFDPILSLPPLGACATQSLRGDAVRNPFPASPPSVRGLDGGPEIELKVDSGSFLVPAQPGRAGSYVAGFRNPDRLPLEGARVNVVSAGGPDVGAVSGSVPMGARPTWTNQQEITRIRAGDAVSISWSAPPAGGYMAAVVGVSVDVANNVSGRFYCLVDAAAGGLEVPGWATANLPGGRPRLFEADAVLAVGLAPRGASGEVAVAGIDAAFSTVTSWIGSTIQVQGGGE